MDRKEFIASLGFSAASLFVASCLGSCEKEGGTPAPSNVDFTIDITQPAYAALANAGGYVYANGIIIAKTTSGTIIAVSQSCTHEGANVQYQSNGNRFYCPRHGASFSTTGSVTGGPTSSPLKQYTVTQTGNSIRITG